MGTEAGGDDSPWKGTPSIVGLKFPQYPGRPRFVPSLSTQPIRGPVTSPLEERTSWVEVEEFYSLAEPWVWTPGRLSGATNCSPGGKLVLHLLDLLVGEPNADIWAEL